MRCLRLIWHSLTMGASRLSEKRKTPEMSQRKLTTMDNHKKTLELFEAYTPTPTPIVIAVTITEENYKSIADLIDAKVDSKGIYMIPGIVDRANFGEVLVYNQR